jgi:hypothetical protein
MRELEIENLGLLELDLIEEKEINGGFLPIIAIYACWGVMAACSAVAIGMGAAGKDKGILR